MPLRSRNKRSIANRTKRHRKKLTSKRYRKLKGGRLGPKIRKTASLGATLTPTSKTTPKTTEPTGMAVKRATSEPTISTTAIPTPPRSNEVITKVKGVSKNSLQESFEQFNKIVTSRGQKPTVRRIAENFIRARRAANVFKGLRQGSVNDSGVKSMKNAKKRAKFKAGQNQLAGLSLESRRTGGLTISSKNNLIMNFNKQKFDNAFTKKLESALAKPKASTTRRANSSPTNVKLKPKPSKVQKANSNNNMTKKQQEVEEKKVKLVEISQKVATNIMRASKQLDDESREKIAERFAQYLAETYGGVGAEDIKVNEIARSLNKQINSVIEAMPTTKRSVRENTFESIMNLFK